jgi:hypothetical protein
MGERAWREMCHYLKSTAPETHQALLPTLAELAPAFELGVERGRALSMASTLRRNSSRNSVRDKPTWCSVTAAAAAATTAANSTQQPLWGAHDRIFTTHAQRNSDNEPGASSTAWRGIREVNLRRSPAGYLGVTVSGGAEHDMLPLISLRSGTQPQYISGGPLADGDELLAIDGQLVAGLTHQAVITLLRSVGSLATLSILPMAVRLGTTSTAAMSVHVLDGGVPITTRPIRENEAHGDAYYFLEPASFLFLLEEGHIAEWGELGGHFYGRLSSSVEFRCPTDPEDNRMVARSGNIHVCHVKRNETGVYGIVIRGGREQNRLAFVARVGQLALAETSPSRPLSGDAILAINGTSTINATTQEMANLIAQTKGGVLRLLLLSQSMQPGSMHKGLDDALVTEELVLGAGSALGTVPRGPGSFANGLDGETEVGDDVGPLRQRSQRGSMIAVLQAARQRGSSAYFDIGPRGLSSRQFSWDDMLPAPTRQMVTATPSVAASESLYTRNAPSLRHAYEPSVAPMSVSRLNEAVAALDVLMADISASDAHHLTAKKNAKHNGADSDGGQPAMRNHSPEYSLVATLEAAALQSEGSFDHADERGEESEDEELPPIPQAKGPAGLIRMESLHGRIGLLSMAVSLGNVMT